MRAAVVTAFGGPEQVEIVEVPVPVPGPGQVRITVEAATLNPVDGAVRAGVFGGEGRRLGLGWDVAGTVDAVGADRADETDGTDGADGAGARFAVGDSVVGLAYGPAKELGTHADQVVLDASALAPAPRSADAVHAATLPLNALTAAQALDRLALEPGRTLLVTGAAGAVGGYAVQLARHQGLVVTGLASDGDEALVRSLGADHFLARSAATAAATAPTEAGAATVPSRFDGVLDAAVLGEAAFALVRDGGAYAGVIPGAEPASVRSVRTAAVEVSPDGDRLAALAALADEGALTLRVAETYALAEAAKGHARLAEGGVRGRLVLVP